MSAARRNRPIASSSPSARRPLTPRNTNTNRAGDRTRTGDVQLGKLAFYQLNYARRSPAHAVAPTCRISRSAEMSGSAVPHPLIPSSPYPRIPAQKKPPMNSEARNQRQSEKRPEPLVGFEPTTARLRIECSTPELQWQRTSRMPWRGFEPRRLSAPPPQDGVSTSFTTRALYFVHASMSASNALTNSLIPDSQIQRGRRGSNPRPLE